MSASKAQGEIYVYRVPRPPWECCSGWCHAVGNCSRAHANAYRLPKSSQTKRWKLRDDTWRNSRTHRSISSKFNFRQNLTTLYHIADVVQNRIEVLCQASRANCDHYKKNWFRFYFYQIFASFECKIRRDFPGYKRRERSLLMVCSYRGIYSPPTFSLIIQYG